MAQFSETEGWRVLGQPERWFEGYLETRSEAPALLQETQQGRICKLAAPIASRDVRNGWATSLERPKAAVEAGE